MPVRTASHPLPQSTWFVAALVWATLAYVQPAPSPAYAESPATLRTPTDAPYAMVPPAIQAASAILVDRATGEILFALDAETQRPIASTTKIMTALLALEQGRPEMPVVVSEGACNTGGSRLHLSPGESIPLGDMVEAMMVKSGNDAAEAIAENIAGSTPAFLAQMNVRAEQLGMTQTHFDNPHGMPMTGGGNVSTARDLAVLAMAALEYPRFCEMVQKSKVSYPVFGIRTEVEFDNTNKLLTEFPLTTGIKTGYTDAARHCLVASAKFRNREVVGVILGAEKATIRGDMVRLFDYGLNRLADDYWIYRKFSLEPQVYPFDAPIPLAPTQGLADAAVGQ